MLETIPVSPPIADPGAWADAFLKAFQGGGWVVPGLIGLYILVRYWPGRRAKKEE